MRKKTEAFPERKEKKEDTSRKYRNYYGLRNSQQTFKQSVRADNISMRLRNKIYIFLKVALLGFFLMYVCYFHRHISTNRKAARFRIDKFPSTFLDLAIYFP